MIPVYHCPSDARVLVGHELTEAVELTQSNYVGCFSPRFLSEAHEVYRHDTHRRHELRYAIRHRQRSAPAGSRDDRQPRFEVMTRAPVIAARRGFDASEAKSRHALTAIMSSRPGVFEPGRRYQAVGPYWR